MKPRIRYVNPIIKELGVRYANHATAKQGKFMHDSHIPILAPAALLEHRPDYLVLLWNIAAEFKRQNAQRAELGTEFVTAVPKLHIT